MEEKKNLLTYAGLKALEDELHDLKVNRRKEVAGKIKEAREQGDLSENAEYDAAKDEQRDIEARIEEIEKILKNAEVVVEDEVDLDKISVGCSVKIYDEEYEEESELSDSNSIFQSITPKPLMEEKYPSPTHAQQGKGKRKTISYGSSDNISRTEQAYRAFEMAKENRKIIEGVVISATMVNMPNGLQDVLFEVVPTESIYNNISVFICLLYTSDAADE